MYFIKTDHSEESSVPEIWMKLHQSGLCSWLPLNEPTKRDSSVTEKRNDATQDEAKQHVYKHTPRQKLKDGAGSRLEHGYDGRPACCLWIT